MTDRVRVLTVVLEDDVREDDVESTVAAIAHIRGVAAVETVKVTGADHLARMVAKHEIARKLYAAVDEALRPERATGAAR